MLFLFLCAPYAPAALAQDAEGLAAYLQTALEQNYEIRAAQTRWEESVAKIGQAGSLPDPKLGVEYFLQPIETRTGPQEASLSLSQSFPWFGRLTLEEQLKQAESAVAQARLADTRLMVARRVKETYIEYGYLSQAGEITSEIHELMSYLEGVARTKYASGGSRYTDVLKIQIELSRLADRIRSLEDNATPVRVMLNSLMGVDRDLARPKPDALPTIVLTKRDDEIIALARQYSPKLLAGQQRIAQGQTNLEIADTDFYPSFTATVKTIFTGEAEFGNPPDSGSDPVVAGLVVNLPVFRERRHSAMAEKRAAIGSARNELEQTVKSLEAEIELSLFRYRDAERRLNLYQGDLIPKVRQELEVSLEAFQGGQYSILELIDAEKNWFNFELAAIRARADMAKEVAMLEGLVGITLADWNNGAETSPKI